MILRIKHIESIEPFKVTCVWSNGELRTVDLKESFEQYANEGSLAFAKLTHYSEFKKVKCDGRTLYWEGLVTVTELDGSKHPAPLDLCPVSLYEKSQPLDLSKLI